MGLFEAIAGRKAAGQQRELSRSYITRLNELQAQFEGMSTDYLERFKTMSSNFDPYNLQNEYDSLYEAVILPMERQFSENILPQIRQGYSRGGYGSGLFSGARESTEAQARQQLSMNEALLKNQARESGIARNFQDYDRRLKDLGLQYSTELAPINSALGIQDKQYGARTDAIGASAAATGLWGDVVSQTISGAGQGAMAGGQAGGPWGAIGGGIAGGAMGLFGGQEGADAAGGMMGGFGGGGNTAEQKPVTNYFNQMYGKNR